jgi:hypothetical protein
MTFVPGIPDWVVLAKQNMDSDATMPSYCDYTSSSYDPNWFNEPVDYYGWTSHGMDPVYIKLNGCPERVEPVLTKIALARALQDNGIICTRLTYLTSKGLGYLA